MITITGLVLEIRDDFMRKCHLNLVRRRCFQNKWYLGDGQCVLHKIKKSNVNEELRKMMNNKTVSTVHPACVSFVKYFKICR